jgi:hypothetical protein
MTTDNFNDTTPAAPSGHSNVKWQNDSSSPTNVSAYYVTPPTIPSVTNLLEGDGSGNGADSGVAIAALAPKASPAFTGTPTAPTAAPATNTTQLATTAFVEAATAALTTGVSSVFGRTGAVTATSGDYTVSEVTGAAPLASPTFTGTPAAPTASSGTNTTQIATTAFVAAAVSGLGGGTVNKYSTTYSSATSVTVTHSLGTTAVIVQCWDSSGNKIEPESTVVTSSSVVTLTFGTVQSGSVVVIG